MNKAEEFIHSKRKSLHPTVKMYPYDEVIELMQLYADEQSRDKAIEFHKWFSEQENWQRFLSKDDEEAFDEWKSNQEGERGKRCCGCCKAEIGNCDCHEQ